MLAKGVSHMEDPNTLSLENNELKHRNKKGAFAYARLFICLFFATVILVWSIGDFNIYLDRGTSREIKDTATATEQFLLSIGIGFVFSTVFVLIFGVVENYAVSGDL